MKFLLVGQIRPDLIAEGWPEDLAGLIEEESKLAAEYHAAGIVERAWSMEDRPGAVAIYNASSRQELDELLGRYPLHKAGYVEVEITALKSYTGIPSGDT